MLGFNLLPGATLSGTYRIKNTPDYGGVAGTGLFWTLTDRQGERTQTLSGLTCHEV